MTRRDRSAFIGRVAQMQRRGVLHVHPILDVGSPARQEWAGVYLDALGELAPEHGFGFTQGREFAKPRSGERAAAYLSSYLARGRGEMMAVGEVVHAAPQVRHVVWLSPRLSRGIWTMRNLRLKRYAWVLAQELGLPVGRVFLAVASMRGLDSQAAVALCSPRSPPLPSTWSASAAD